MHCYIGIGSNIGDRIKNIEDAIKGLRESSGIKVKRVSKIYETEPVGPPQPKYLNGVAEIETGLSPHELLSVLEGIESAMGRRRVIRWGPRTIDLDILTYGGKKIDEPDLKIPHPLMNEREFVQRPLRELL